MLFKKEKTITVTSVVMDEEARAKWIKDMKLQIKRNYAKEYGIPNKLVDSMTDNAFWSVVAEQQRLAPKNKKKRR